MCRYFFICYNFIITLVICSFGDIIHLKTGGQIEGTIIERQGGSITVDIGFGTTSVDTADILKIGRSNKSAGGNLNSQPQTLLSEDDRSVPRQLKPFVESMHRLRSLRKSAASRKKELERLAYEIDSLEKSFSRNAGEYASLNEDLRNVSEKGIYEQYKLIGKAHEYNSSIIECQMQLKERQQEKEKGNRALLIYMDSLANFDRAFNALKKSVSAKPLKDTNAILKNIEKDLSDYKADFETAAIDVTFIAGNHILVPVHINGKASVSLLLDTGASSVVLSRLIASKLGIVWHNGTEVKVTLANGEETKGYAVVLKSVEVENFRARDVKAIVLEKGPAPGINGLLGMSFLDRFLVHIDAVNKKLVLKEFMAR